MHEHVEKSYPSGSVDLGHDLMLYCHVAIDLIEDAPTYDETIIDEFTELFFKRNQILIKLREWHPRLMCVRKMSFGCRFPTHGRRYGRILYLARHRVDIEYQ